MSAPISQSTYVANVLAQAHGVTDPDAVASVKRDAADFWQSCLNSASGRPLGGPDDRSH
jgi:hypothetical protein